MAVDASAVASAFEKLKLEAERERDPCWLPPKPWESIPSESGMSSSSTSHSHPEHCIYGTTSVSESSLVRLAMNALQGMESAIITIEKLCALFCSESADRTSHRISSLWSQALSTLALGNLLKSIGRFGCTVFLLRKFVNHFTSARSDGSSDWTGEPSKQTLVNQAFAVAVGKVLDAYISGLNTLYASVSLRRSSKADGGCPESIENSKITLLELHLHTVGLRTQIEALGSICNINDIVLGFSASSFESLSDKATSASTNFPRGARLLTFLYTELKVSESVHYALLKFLFIRSLEPYCRFIRSWIFEGHTSDPYNEFVVEYVGQMETHGVNNCGISASPLASIRVRDGVALPCFLEEFLIPLFRAGQQLQVVMKLLEYNNVGPCYATREEILPSLNFSSEHRHLPSALMFDKGTMEASVSARNGYYQKMLEKVEEISTKFSFRSQEVSVCDIQFANAKKHVSKLDHRDSVMDEGLVSPLSDRRDQDLPISKVDSETSSIEDECSYLLDSSESTSCIGSEEQNDSELTVYKLQSNMMLVPSCLSALDFSVSTYPAYENNQILHNNLEHTGEVATSRNIYLENDCGDPHMPEASVSKGENCQNDVCSALGDLENSFYAEGENSRSAWSDNVDYWLEVSSKMLGVRETDMLSYENSIFCGGSLIGKTNCEDHHLRGPFASSNLFSLLSSKLTIHPNFLSMNPILMKKYLRDSDSKCGKGSFENPGQLYSHFDFTSVKDPFQTSVERLTTTPKQLYGAEFPVTSDAFPTPAPRTSDHLDKEGCGDKKQEDMAKLSHVYTPLGLKDTDGRKLLLTDGSGGSSWESLLGGFGKTADVTGGYPSSNTAVTFEMPLDFVIRKFLWEEILLQYRFVSKLTIKLLEEGFDLREHLLALRRYHFMEVADWADLFITTLWNHKWCITDAVKRIPEIHGALELAVQGSSCGGDPNKSRLYLYVKGGTMSPASSLGIHSFDFLGLGYRVEWPVNIILTPDALKIYSEIFNFLIQIKLAVFFLTDAWCSLKNLVQLTKKIHRLELHKQGLAHISILLETRHLVNHFVCTLQQYVQSQLSHVSWCKFLRSLKHQVKDMMDLESVHFAYLADSLHICFLSNDTRPIANIIQSILECAVDFRSCLIGSSLEAGSDEKSLLSKLSQINIHQVLAVKKTFAKNVKDLYLLHLKSPKHVEFGVSRFWNCLNYNEYYSEIVAEQIGRHALPF